jgi:uncharacterized membrane protein
MTFQVRFTADVTTPESAELGDFEASGWIDPYWSMRVLHDSDSDLTESVFDTLEEAEAFIEKTIGPADSYDGGSWYAADGEDDYASGAHWSYAGHITEV